MSGLESFLQRYEFLNLTKSVTESQMALYREPSASWSQIGSKLYHICLYNGLSIAAVGADVTVYLAVSTLRSLGLFCPPPPEPPVFPLPQNNVQFIDHAIKRALWDWDPWSRKEIEEGIASHFSEKWNVYAVIGEWSFAYSLEMMAKGSHFKPSFLTISEQLENGASFRSVCTDFARLWDSEKRAILTALYTQTTPSALGFKANKVYQEIRGLASILNQGNQNYLNALTDYVKRHRSLPETPLQGKEQHFPPPPPLPLPPVTPSAPPPLSERDLEVEMATDVAVLRRAVTGKPNTRRLRSEILSDRGNPLSPTSAKTVSAQLLLLQAFESSENRPPFLPWKQSLESGKTFHQAMQDFSSLNKADLAKLHGAIVDPWRGKNLSAPLKERLSELTAFGKILSQSKDFSRVYEALRIDLLAPA